MARRTLSVGKYIRAPMRKEYMMRRFNHHQVVARLAGLRMHIRYIVQRMQGKEMLHFLHIGKTGGTAMKYALSRYPGGRYFIYFHSHNTRLRDIPEGEKAIFFLRDPVSRFVSGFYSRKRQGQPKYFSPWSPEEKEAFAHFHTPNELAIAIFSEELEEKERAQRAMQCIQHVRSSYWDWFESKEYFMSRLLDIFFIGFQESLTEDFENLCSKLGWFDYVELPDDENAHRTPAEANRTLTDEAVKNLQKWYKDDYEFLRLCKALIRKYPSLHDGSPPIYEIVMSVSLGRDPVLDE
ncbi:MAG: hypothetical protein D6732_25330 [Methanobacteriota archaeon]|nr:MAG: hypothetical protein D6732_25330 [Euryarchaeota archaeon]